jgi:hypothetical protein
MISRGTSPADTLGLIKLNLLANYAPMDGRERARAKELLLLEEIMYQEGLIAQGKGFRVYLQELEGLEDHEVYSLVERLASKGIIEIITPIGSSVTGKDGVTHYSRNLLGYEIRATPELEPHYVALKAQGKMLRNAKFFSRIPGPGLEITYNDISREIKINDVLLSTPQYESENQRVFGYLYNHPNENISLKVLAAAAIGKSELGKSLHQIVNDLGFKGPLAKVFFNKSSKAIQLNNPITSEQLAGLGLDVEEVVEIVRNRKKPKK